MHMRLNLDQTTDFSNKELYSSFKGVELPNYVKQAEATTKEATANLPTESFADRYHRAFPVNSASDTYVSQAFYMAKKAELKKLWGANYVEEVGTRLTKAAELFGITEDVEQFNRTTTEKAAVDYTEQFIASFQLGDSSYDLFPYKTAMDLTKAAEDFSNNIKSYPFNWRTTIAANFVKKAEEFGIDHLPDLLCKYGGLFFPDTRLFQAELERRMHKLGEKAQEKYASCIKNAENISSRADALTLCGEAYMIEKEAGVYDNNQVYRQLGDVVDKTFTISIYKMADFLNVVEMAGDPYSIDDLKKVSKDIYKQAFDYEPDFDKLSETKDILKTMPTSDVALFKELSGVRPL